MTAGNPHENLSTLGAALAALASDPGDTNALAALAALTEGGGNGHGKGRGEPAIVRAVAEATRIHRERGDFELCLRLIDLQIGAEQDDSRRADLYFDKGRILTDELLRDDEAARAFERVLELRPDDEAAEDALGHIALVRDNWEKILRKYLDEVKSSTDRQLTGSLYLSVAELHAKFRPDDNVETYLKKALEVDPRNVKASQRLERVLRGESRWEDLARLYDQRAEAAPTREERVHAYLALADVERGKLGRLTEAAEADKKVLGIDPTNARALQTLVEHYTTTEAWQPLIRVYENALRARPRGEPELGTLLQIAMIWWKKVGNLEAADEYWKRIRKAEPAHPAMLEFYRQYHTADAGKLLPILQQAQRITPGEGGSALDLALETARAAERSQGAAERAIDLWKAVLKLSPGNIEATGALERLYERTEKWNALLELHKEALEALNRAEKSATTQPAKDAITEEKIARLFEMVRVYRDKLSFEQMVVNTYGQILQLRPDNLEALDALTQRYEASGRWNDLINVLQRRADNTTDRVQKATLLRRIAGLWIDKFGNLHQAVRPLEELWTLDPDDAEVVARLRDLYTRRRAWRALLDLERKEEERLLRTGARAERRAKLIEIAKLTAERLGDAKEAIGAWNRLLEVDANDPDALPALAALYEREKRWPALVEILRRQATLQPESRARVQLLERAASILSERLTQPERAAELYKEVLELQPGHPRATRTLQALFAQAGRLDDLIAMYAKSGQWDELFEVLQQTAERLPAAENERRIDILTRAAGIARDQLRSQDKAARAYERILALDTSHKTDSSRIAAEALADLYAGQEKWARLLAIHEVLLGFAKTIDEQLARIREIQAICADKLGSRGLAFSWAARAYALRPSDTGLEADLERLAEAAETWDELADIYQKELAADLPAEQRLRRLRQLADISLNRQHKLDDARKYYEQILVLAPGDSDALAALEQLFSEGQSYPQLRDVYRQREAVWRGSAADRIDLLFKIAWIEEEKLSDNDSARKTLEKIRGMEPGPAFELRALRAQERLELVAGASRTAALADVLERQLVLADSDEARVELGARLASLYAGPLANKGRALDHLERALALDPIRRATHAALEALLDATTEPKLDDAQRQRTLALLVPAYEERLKGATGDEVGRTASRLLQLFEQQLVPQREHEPRLALMTRMAQLADDVPRSDALERRKYEWAAERFEADPSNRELRYNLAQLAESADRLDDLAVRVGDVEGRTNDQQLRHDLAIELGQLFEGPLGMNDEAATAYRRALEVDPVDPVAEPALERLYKTMERFGELRALYVARKDRALDTTKRMEALVAITDLDEGVLEDRDAAIASYRELLDLDPQAVRPFRALERLYAVQERWPELEALLAAREPFQPSPRDDAAVRGTPESRAHFRFRRGDLFRDRLGDLGRAVDLYEETVAEEPTHEGARKALEAMLKRAEVRLRVARILQPVYEADQAWPKLALVLGAERESLEGIDAVPLLARLATLQEEKLGARQLALATWREALRIEPADEQVRSAVERLAVLLGRHGDLAAAWDEAYLASDADDLPLRAELLTRSAKLYERELRDSQKAVATWRKLFDLDPTNAELGRPASQALARLYESEEQWAQLVEVLRREVEWANDPDARRALLVRIARIQEELIRDSGAAIGTYRELLEADPSDKSALDGLEKLHAAKAEWPELAEVLRRRLELENDGKARRDLLFRLAQLTERELADADGAVAAYGAVLDEAPEDVPAMEALMRLHEKAGRKHDLLELLERRIQLEASRGKGPALELLRMQAAALDLDLGRAESALERFREVLEADPRHEGAMRGLEPLLDDENLRLRAAEILEPRYSAIGDNARLLKIHELVADASPDLRERISRFERAAKLRTTKNDRDGAFDDLAKAARLAVGEPDLGELLDKLEAVVPADKRNKLVALYQSLGPDILDVAVQERVQLTVASESEKLGDRQTARESYRRVLDASPENPVALDALEKIYEAGEEWGPLYEVYARRAELAQGDGDARRHYLLLGARLSETHLDRPADAIPAYEEALELQPHDLPTSRALEARYQAAGRWHELAELLERRLGFTDELHEAVSLRVQLGRLFEQDINDVERAVESYRAALGGDPSNAEAITALERHLEDPTLGPSVAEVLEPVYVARHDWHRLVRVCEIRLEAAEDTRARLALRRRIARIYEEQLEDLDQAFTAYTLVYREDATDRGTRDQLSRLAGVLSAWERLAKVYEDYLADVGPEGDGAEEALRALASVYHERLADVDRARGAYNRLLERDRDDEIAFISLEKLLERAGRWAELLETYKEAAQNTLDQSVRLRLLHQAALVAEEQLDDADGLDQAIQLNRDALDVDPSDKESPRALERLFTRGKRWHDLAELVERRVAEREAADTTGWTNDKLQLADLRALSLEDKPGAIDLYEEVLGRVPAEPRAVRALEKIIIEPEHTYRIAQLLGPIYRADGSWQKLVVIFEAELGYIDTPEARYERFIELADLHEKSGGKPARAFDALLRAWGEQVVLGDDSEARPREEHLYEELVRLAGLSQRFPELADELEKAVLDSLDQEIRGRVYRRVAQLAETQINDRGRAVRALEQVLVADESDDAAWTDLERLLAQDARHRDLVAALERRAGVASDPELRRGLYERAAKLYEEQLKDASAAIVAWSKVLEIEPEDQLALSSLARLHRARNEHLELAEILDRQIASAADAAARRALRGELGTLAAGPLRDGPRAADVWRAVLAEEPRDRDALVELRRVELAAEHYPEALEVTDALAELSEGAQRSALRIEAAELVEKKLEDVPSAIDRYAVVLAEHDPAARAALERLARDRDVRGLAAAVLDPYYTKANEHGALVDLGELMVESETDPAEKREWLVKMAQASERGLRDGKRAFSLWARALREEPADVEARNALERLAELENIPGELARIYEELLTQTQEPDILRTLAQRLGELYEQKIGDQDRAIVAYGKALDGAEPGDDAAALEALDRLLSRAGRPRDLAEVLRKRAEGADDNVARVTLLHRLGALQAGELVDLDSALDAYRDALEVDPAHAPSRQGMEALLDSAPHRSAALDVLEPLYERDGDAAKQNLLAEVRLGTLRDDAEQGALLERIAERAENALRDPRAAFAALARALKLDPASERLVDESERLAALMGQPQEAATLFEAQLGDRDLSPDSKRSLQLRAGRIWEHAGANDKAEARYLAILADDKDDAEALEALDRLYRVRGDAGKLADVLARRAEVELDVEAKRGFYAEAARIVEQSLGAPDRAVDLYRKILEVDDTDADTVGALARLLEQRARWPELADLLAKAAEASNDPRQQAALLSRVATLSAERLNDLPRAIAALRELLELEPESMQALDALIDLEGRRGDASALKEALERKLGATPNAKERIPVFRRLAELAATDAIDDALGYLYEILALEPADAAAGQLQRKLLTRAERWHDLVDVLTAEATRLEAAGDTKGELATLVQAADVWTEKLESPESATEILERIVKRDPSNVRALLSLARIAEESGDSDRAREMLAGAEANAKTPEEIAELAFRRGRVDEEAGDAAAAAGHYRRAIASQPTHLPSLDALVEQARTQGDHAALAQLLESRIQAEPTRALRIELGKLYIEKLGSPDRARPHLEALLAEPGLPEADAGKTRELLADLHFVAGRVDEARPLYQALVDAANQARRRGKDVAKLHGRLGEIAEKKGDVPAALASFAESQRLDASHAPTLVALGRLHRAKGDWEAARKVYRSLLLQNLDADAGISKGGVYRALGEIHEQLNEGPKAVGMYERALELEPGNDTIRQSLARLRGA